MNLPGKTNKLKLKVKVEWKAALTIATAFTILILLGFWQLDRAKQKRHLQQSIEARHSAKPVAIEQVLNNETGLLHDLRVSLHGNFLARQSIMLTNQFYRGQMGYEIFDPFRLKATRRIIIVSRGWTPALNDDQDWQGIEPPAGELGLTGLIHIPPRRSFFKDQEIKKQPGQPIRLHHFNLASLDQLYESAPLPFLVRLDPDSPAVLNRHWPRVNTNAQRSTTYAYQWFGMAALLLLATLLKCTNITQIIQRGPNA